jgi:hypothetical protein
MIVNRRIFIPKHGHMREVLDLLKAEFARCFPEFKAVRYYVSDIGPFDRFGMEMEFPSLAEYERAVAQSGECFSPEFWQRWYELTESGGTNEIWTVE